MTKNRDEIPEKYRWNLSHLFPNFEAWEKEKNELLAEKTNTCFWPELSKGKRDISSPLEIKKILDSYFRIERKTYNALIYCMLWRDEDVGDTKSKESFEQCAYIAHKLGEEAAWIRPLLLSLSEEILFDAELKEYENFLKKLLDLKPHTLTEELEALISLTSKPLTTAQQAFGMFNNADITFTPATTETGEEKELTHGSYSLYLQDSDRTLRKTAFTHLHEGFQKFENTLTELLQGHVHTHNFTARARGYKSCLEAALTPNNIPTSVYTTLIETVRENLGALHSYIALRKELLGYDSLHLYDLHVPLKEVTEKKYTYDEAVDIVLEAVSPLGATYQTDLEKGLKSDRWVDVYETKRKRSGAYSCSSYDSPPYILLNFQGTLRDVMTLAHEAGHSMHSFYSNKTQSFQDSRYPIFVAEVASTFNEELVFQLLLSRCKTEDEKAYLLSRKIDDIRSTLYRQTQFAEFELLLHTLAEQGVPLTPAHLKNEYTRLNKEYYGDALTLDPQGAVEFLRIPHFYSNFYVYQYATGISAAFALVERVTKNGEDARKQYLNFLSSGCAKYPIDLLRDAGVDMTTKQPVEILAHSFSSLCTQFSEMSGHR